MFEERLREIEEGLRRLREGDRELRLFGASAHRHAMRAAATAEEVASFESEHGVRLPEDYRAFLVGLGNGGAGPFYGIFPLGTHDDEAGDLVGQPNVAFPYTAAWRLSDDEIEALDDDETGALEAEYWRPLDGALPVVLEGAGRHTWLVVTGPERGHVWQDTRDDRGGFRPWASGAAWKRSEDHVVWRPPAIGGGARQGDAPDEPDRERLTFLEWYELWLARAVRALA